MTSTNTLSIHTSPLHSSEMGLLKGRRPRSDEGAEFYLPQEKESPAKEPKQEEEEVSDLAVQNEPVVTTSKAVENRMAETEPAANSAKEGKSRDGRGKTVAEKKVASAAEKSSPNNLVRMEATEADASKAVDVKGLVGFPNGRGIPSAFKADRKMSHFKETIVRSDLGMQALTAERGRRPAFRSPLSSEIAIARDVRSKTANLESNRGNDSGTFSQQDFSSRSQSLVSQTLQQAHATHTAQDLNPLLMSALHRMQESQQKTMRMSLRMSDGTTLGIRLELSGGRIKTHFKTEDEALRQSIQNGWNSLINEAAENGIQLDPPQFEDRLTP